ncbi:hypothetical protein BG004_002150, partial [Podila humilis]
EDKDLTQAVEKMVASHPDTAPVVARLLEFMNSKIAKRQQQPGIAQFFSKPVPASRSTSASASAALPSASNSSPSSIASTLDTSKNTNNSNNNNATAQSLSPVVYSTSPLSFLHPVRKKLILAITASELALVVPPTAAAATTTSTTTTASLSISSSPIPASEIVARAPYDAVLRVIAVPFLERATKHTAILIFFRHAKMTPPSSKDAIWVVPVADDGKDFTLHFNTMNKQLAGLTMDLTESGSTTTTATKIPIAITNYKRPDQLLMATLSYFVYRAVGPVLYPSIDMIPIPTTSSSSYPNFSAHLKSNQGTIYLLPTGMLFAFRKPVLFLPSTSIEAVGVHSVLSRTFDFEVVMDTKVASVEELEGLPNPGKDGRICVGFGMVDTKNFGKMEEWINKAGIRDRSMSEDLKAKDKSTTANSKKRERAADDDGAGGDDDGDVGEVGVKDKESTGGSQRKKKQQQQQENQGRSRNNDDDDDDDEEDEDFAPESEDDIMEEYDSDAEGSDGSDQGTNESRGKASKGTKSRAAHENGDDDDEEDLGEESLGEDEDDEEDEDEDQEDQEEEEDELLDD